ncbi:O-antigen ligase domain-containing protein [Acetobacteraceae bacterium H6797]|nr:O-antigen ligase domain-containing protein [Acetobacteraceae bacterium H6797]
MPALAAPLGACAAVVQFAGALKSTPMLASLPFDLTLAALALSIPLMALLLASRRWRIGPGIAIPLAGCGGLWLWMTIAGAWSPSDEILQSKLPELVLLGPLMLAMGMAVGADAQARLWLVGSTLVIGPLVGISIAIGLSQGAVVLGGLVGARPDLVRVQYQLAGLAMACAASLAAVKALEASGLRRLAWIGLVLGLAAGVLLPGGRAALVALALTAISAPAAALWAAGRRRAVLGLGAGGAGLALAILAFLMLDPSRMDGLRTLERLTEGPVEASARPVLWAAALDWAGESAPFGLGTGGFTIAAGHGERRGLYPHNHALESLAEGGIPGLVLWLMAFAAGLWSAFRRLGHVSPGRIARIAALVLPVALSVMVSTDLGNRMAWFALGLALSLSLESRHG